jgi:hypothetical protein
MPIGCTEAFYLALPVLHGLGALLATGLSFGCDTGKAQQTARIPALIAGYNATRAGFVAAYPWDEGAEFVTHTWNPFALIIAFEWLTAGFALRPLQYFSNKDALLRVWLVWLSLGLLVFIGWTASNSGGPCVAQLCVVIVSFIVSMALALISFPDPADQTGRGKRGEDAERLMQFADEAGRVWHVPTKTLRQRTLAAGRALAGASDSPMAVNRPYENLYGVVLRYAEYCVTAPLLLLAVVCLMVADGPAWLFLTAYWLLIVCNALGVVLHITFSEHQDTVRRSQSDSGGIVPCFVQLFFTGPW